MTRAPAAPPFVLRALAAALALALVGCAPTPCADDAGTSAERARDIQTRIFGPRCSQSGCHGADSPALNLNLMVDNVEQTLVNATSGLDRCRNMVLVRPGDPEGSFLYIKLRDRAPGCGQRMPLGRPALPASEMACIYRWIAAMARPPGDGGAGDANPCGAGQAMCNGACIPVAEDNAHCGACGNACPAGTRCAGGQCACGATGQVACAGVCVDTRTSATHCGRCGNACGAGQACANGACVCATAGLTACAGACVDTQTNAMHCGACGAACPAGQSCQAGRCACPPGQTLCGASCVELASSVANCGACGRACAAGQVCSMGACGSGCAGATTNCGGACVDTQTSAMHCGACGRACAAGQACVAGACACPGGGLLCGGVCVNAQTDPANCGACGRACGAGQACTSGACACPAGQTLCAGACVDTRTSAAHCGACGRACAGGQTCAAGACACAAGQTFCTNACVDTQTSAAHCGACGRACAAGQTCAAGACSCGATTVSLSRDLQPILTSQCADGMCHGGSRPADNLSLVAGASHAQMVGVRSTSCMDGRLRVAPGNPGASYLMHKLQGVMLCGGGQMPLRAPPLSPSQIDLFRAWICAGAPNN